MTDRPLHTRYHARWHRSRMSTYWWLERRSYFAFILRELSSIFVAWSVVYLLALVRAVSRGDSDYQQFMQGSGRPAILVLNVIALGFVVYHAVTWFNLAPQAMVARLGGKRVPDILIAASNYAAWVAASALVAWIILGG